MDERLPLEIGLLVVIVLTNLGVFHELAHAFSSLAFGYHVSGIYIGFPYSYTRVDNVNVWTLLSGGLTDTAIYVALFGLWFRKKFNAPSKVIWFLLFWAAIHFIYAWFETAYFLWLHH